ncbi:heme exporter protein CcmD [Planktotalea arctica]|uniref:heme exporter protein CcmD n=1 Tax=Planktotalea arctica TaxID=1481893 RepID=UPI000A17603B|nr:heme exporter protein CcmD [Planktotalea arctica]
MMPDLGKYADAVLGAYAASIVLLIAIVALSIWQARRTKAALDDVEKRRNG